MITVLQPNEDEAAGLQDPPGKALGRGKIELMRHKYTLDVTKQSLYSGQKILYILQEKNDKK